MDSEYISSLTDEQLAALREEIVESLDDDVRVNEAAGLVESLVLVDRDIAIRKISNILMSQFQ